MPVQVVKRRLRVQGGGIVERIDHQGGIFSPVRGQRPVYSYGPKGQGGVREVMFQCPVSAIPDLTWDLLQLWRDCRTMQTLPMAGGWLDQPKLIRLAFPVFEREMQAVEQSNGSEAERAAALAVAGMAKAMGGKG